MTLSDHLPTSENTSIAPGIISTKDLEAVTASVEERIRSEYQGILQPDEFGLLLGFIGIIKDSVIFLGGKTSAGEVKRSINRKLVELIETDSSISPREAAYINMTATLLTKEVDSATGGQNDSEIADVTHIKFSLLSRLIVSFSGAVQDITEAVFNNVTQKDRLAADNLFRNAVNEELKDYYDQFHDDMLPLSDMDNFISAVSKRVGQSLPREQGELDSRLVDFVISKYRYLLKVNFNVKNSGKVQTAAERRVM